MSAEAAGQAPFAVRMREAAARCADPTDARMLESEAAAFAETVARYVAGGASSDVLVAAWHRARQTYCRVTGMPLLVD